MNINVLEANTLEISKLITVAISQAVASLEVLSIFIKANEN